jgi:hypothetical protein
MREAEIRSLYRTAIRVEPHPYTGPEGHYLVYRARSQPFGMIFATDYRTGRVDSFRIGRWRYVQLIEGCA